MTTDSPKETKTAVTPAGDATIPAPPTLGKTEETPVKKGRPLFHRPVVVLVLLIVVILGIIIGAKVMYHALTHETTDDAFIDGHVISVAPRVAGRILKVNAKDNEEVKTGQVLFEIDPTDYAAVVAQKKAALEVSIAKEKAAEASVQQSQVHLQTLAAGVDAMQAMADASKLSTQLSHSDEVRGQSLIKKGVVSAQDFEHTKSASDTADATLVSKVKEVDATKAFQEEAKAAAVSSAAQAGAAAAEVNEEQAMLATAELQLSYTKAVAAEDGRITTKSVEAGDYVQVGQNLMALVTPEVWVTANFKETQITNMRAGEPVMVTVDAYPARELRAHVDSIQAGSGARFSLLPPENATGNFVKVVQRVPVKIVFDEGRDVQQVLGPGMSAVPDVKVKDGTLTALVITVLAAVAILAAIVAALFWLKRTAKAQA